MSVFSEMNFVQKLIAISGAIGLGVIAALTFTPCGESPDALQSSELASSTTATASTGGGFGGQFEDGGGGTAGGTGGTFIDVTVTETSVGYDYIDELEDPMFTSSGVRCPADPHCEVDGGGGQ